MCFSKSVRILIIISLLPILFLGASTTNIIAEEEGLIGYWNFDNLKEGDTMFFDLSGNGRNGYLYNTRLVDGKNGKALKFDGRSSYAEIPYDSGLSSPKAISVEAWIYPTPPHQADRNGGIINNINGRPNNRLLIMNNNKPLAELSLDVPPPKVMQVDGPALPNGTWSHVVFVYDGTHGIVYVNGTPGKPVEFDGEALTGTTPLTLGWGHTGDNYHYCGLIDDVKIYNRALSANEIVSKATNKSIVVDDKNSKGSSTPNKGDLTILLQEGFEGTGRQLPVGWVILGGLVEVTNERSSKGSFSIKVNDTSSIENAGIRTRHVAVEEGSIYLASVESFNESGISQIYFEFWNSKGSRIAHTVGTNSTKATWQTMFANGVAPEGATSATLLLYGHGANVGVSYYDNVLITKAAKMPESIFTNDGIAFKPSFRREHKAIINVHPRLYYTKEDIPGIKQASVGFTKSSYLKEKNFTINHYRVKQVTYALPPVQPVELGPPPGFAPGGYTYWTEMSREIQDRMESLSLLYVTTGQKECAKLAISYALSLAEWEKWNEYALPSLPLAHLTFGTLAVYDMLYSEMTEAERVKIREAVIKKCINPTAPIAHLKSADNTQALANVALGLAALTFLSEEDGMASYVKSVKDWSLWCLDEMLIARKTEGLLYTSYAIEYIIRFADSLARITGDTDLLEHPYLREELIKWVLYFLSPDGSTWANFDDSSITPEFYITMNILANRYSNGYAGWYLDKTRKGIPSTFIGIIYGAKGYPTTSLDKWPTSAAFNIGWAALRSGWKADDVLLAFKSNASNWFHNHWDQNNFILNVHGEWLLSDPGYHSYNPGIESEVTTGAKGHNCILFDGEAQSLVGGGVMVGFLSSPNFDYVAGDATGAYVNLGIGKWQRDILYLKPDYFLIFDEVATGMVERSVELVLRPATGSDVYLDGKRTSASPSILEALFGKSRDVTATEIGIHRPLASAVFKTLWPTGMLVKYEPYKGAEKYGPYIRIGPQEKIENETFVSMITTEANKVAKINAKGATPPKVDLQKADNKISLIVYGEDTQEFILHKRYGDTVDANKVSSDGRYSVVSIDKGNNLNHYALVEGTNIVWDGSLLAKADHPVTLAFGCEYEGKVWSGSIYSKTSGVVNFYVSELSSVIRNGEALSSILYTYKDKMLTIRVEAGTTTFQLLK